MLEVRGLTVSYGSHVAVDDLDLTAADGEVLGILGPSGCGKSTLLRAIAGLEPPDRGTIRLDGILLDGLRPDQREVGLMFQDHALFPHRTVAENVGFGPRMRGWSAKEIAGRVRDALDLVDLAGTGGRPVTSLSGGEQQRVALARAVAAQPRLLMLDEPLGSLDRALRDRLLTDLPALLRNLGTTVLYVTHDQDEALALADRVAVMRAARIEQVALPDELWREPVNAFVARFLGLEHVFEAQVTNGTAITPLGDLPVEAVDGPAQIALLLDALRLIDTSDDDHPEAGATSASAPPPPPQPAEVRFQGEVVGRRFAGDHLRVRVRTRRGPELTVPLWRGSPPPVGSSVTVALDLAAIRVLPPTSAEDPAEATSPGGVDQ
jgi:thiamine transport system ATP-binding protein